MKMFSDQEREALGISWDEMNDTIESLKKEKTCECGSGWILSIFNEMGSSRCASRTCQEDKIL